MIPSQTVVTPVIEAKRLGLALLCMAVLAGTGYGWGRHVLDRSAFFYDSSQSLQFALDAQDLFWRQSHAASRFFFSNEPEVLQDFHRRGGEFLKTIQLMRPELFERDGHEDVYAELIARYCLFLSAFERTRRLYRVNDSEAARAMELTDLQSAEMQVRRALESVLGSQAARLKEHDGVELALGRRGWGMKLARV